MYPQAQGSDNKSVIIVLSVLALPTIEDITLCICF